MKVVWHCSNASQKQSMKHMAKEFCQLVPKQLGDTGKETKGKAIANLSAL